MLGALQGESIGVGEVFERQDALAPVHGRRQFFGIYRFKVVFLRLDLEIRALADRNESRFVKDIEDSNWGYRYGPFFSYFDLREFLFQVDRQDVLVQPWGMKFYEPYAFPFWVVGNEPFFLDVVARDDRIFPDRSGKFHPELVDRCIEDLVTDDIFQFDNPFFKLDVSLNPGNDLRLSLFDIQSAGIIGCGVTVPGCQEIVVIPYPNAQSPQFFQAYGTE